MVDAIEAHDAVDEIVRSAVRREPLSVSALAVHGLMVGVGDNGYRSQLNSFDIVLPDGQPVRWALNRLHHTSLRERARGTDMTVQIARRAAHENLGVYLYGSTPGTLRKFEDRLVHLAPGLQVAGRAPSRFRRLSPKETTDTASTIRGSGASIVFVGLGCPRQERFVHAMRDRVGVPLISVGAAFDYIGGVLRQPPPAVQRAGLEWSWRLLQEPGRLWRRYLVLNPAYATMVLLQGSGLWDPATVRVPERLEVDTSIDG